jgi:hypothetical protein
MATAPLPGLTRPSLSSASEFLLFALFLQLLALSYK